MSRAAEISFLPIGINLFNGTPDGATDNLAELTTFGVAGDRVKVIPGGDYYLSAAWTPPAQDIAIQMAGSVEFSNAHPDFRNLIPFQSGPGPLWSQLLVSKTYGAAWAGQGICFQIASYAHAAVTTVPVVAVFGQGRSSVAGSKAWGGNFVAYADNATSSSIATEFNCGALVAGGQAYGIVIASAGTNQVQNALQIQSNDTASQFLNGIEFNWRSTEGLLTKAAIRVSGATGATCENLIRATSVSATLAEVDLPSFVVGATPATVDARVSINASSSATASVRVVATSADANVQLRPKGAGNSQLADSSGNAKVAANATGIGFNGTTPVAKPTITGSRGGNAALASLLTQLAALGLITDSSS